MSFWRTEFRPIFVGYSTKCLPILKQASLTSYIQPCLIARKPPFYLYFWRRIKCRAIPNLHGELLAAWLCRLASEKNDQMPCLCPLTDAAREELMRIYDHISPCFFIFENPDDLLTSLSEGEIKQKEVQNDR